MIASESERERRLTDCYFRPVRTSSSRDHGWKWVAAGRREERQTETFPLLRHRNSTINFIRNANERQSLHLLGNGKRYGEDVIVTFMNALLRVPPDC